MKTGAATTILRWGLSFVLFCVAVEALRHPEAWSGATPHLLVSAVSAYELVLAVWLFWGRRLAWSSLLAAGTFAVIALANLGADTLMIVFGMIGLTMAALALFELARGKDFKEDDAE